jgi:exopolyphosphatase/pppGpp-phosphohydrolase
VGSGELTRSCLPSDPPAAAELAEARACVAAALEAIDVPRPRLAAAVGGSAATTATVVGMVLDPPALTRSLRMLSVEPAADVARRYGVARERVRLLPAGLLILQAASERFGVPLSLGRGGLREGILLEGCHG